MRTKGNYNHIMYGHTTTMHFQQVELLKNKERKKKREMKNENESKRVRGRGRRAS
jgi:hypothetical protein